MSRLASALRKRGRCSHPAFFLCVHLVGAICWTVIVSACICRSIKAFSNEIHKRKEPLDVLVNNAGVFLVEHNRTQEGFEVVQGINYFGTFLLTHLLLDKLKETSREKGHAR